MNRLLPLLLLTGCTSFLALGPAAKADFGAADLGSEGNEYSIFSAWCAKRGNDCRVEFTSDGIVVNKGTAVPYGNVVTFT